MSVFPTSVNSTGRSAKLRAASIVSAIPFRRMHWPRKRTRSGLSAEKAGGYFLLHCPDPAGARVPFALPVKGVQYYAG